VIASFDAVNKKIVQKWCIHSRPKKNTFEFIWISKTIVVTGIFDATHIKCARFAE